MSDGSSPKPQQRFKRASTKIRTALLMANQRAVAAAMSVQSAATKQPVSHLAIPKPPSATLNPRLSISATSSVPQAPKSPIPASTHRPTRPAIARNNRLIAKLMPGGPARQVRSDNSAASQPTHERIKAIIAELRKSIESSERGFKEVIFTRRITPSGIFQNMDELAGLFVENELHVNWVDRAQRELNHEKSRRLAQEHNKQIVAAAIKDKTMRELETAKEQIRRRKQIFQARPKFSQQCYSVFGSVIFASALNDSMFVVFNSANMIEVWVLQTTDGTTENKIVKLFDLKCDPVCFVEHLYSGPMNPVEQTSEQPQVGILNFMGDPRAIAQTTVESIASSRQSSAPSSAAPSPPRSRPQSGRLSTINMRDFDAASRRVSSAIIEVASRRVSFDNMASLEKVMNHTLRKRNDMNRALRKTVKLDEISAPEVENLDEIERLLSPEDLQLFRENVGVARFHSVFFVGCKTGEAAVIEIVWEFDALKKTTEFSLNILSKKRISHLPIRHLLYYRLDDGLPLLVTEICTITGEHLLEAFRMNFEIEWACKCEQLRMTSVDRMSRMIPQDRLEYSGRPITDFSSFSTMTVTSICEDERFAGLLVSLRNGSIVRINYDREMMRLADTRDSQMVMLETTMSLGDTKTLKISWVLDLFAAQPEDQSVSAHPAAHGHLSTISEMPPGLESEQPKPRGRRMGRMSISRPNDFEVVSMRYFISRKSNKPQIMIFCSDGIVRVYPDEMVKATTNLKQSMHLQMDRKEKILGGTLEIDEDEDEGSGDTQNKLVAIDVNDPFYNYVELKLTGSRQGIVQDPTQKPAGPGNRRRHHDTPHGVHIVDEERGIGLVYSGREWGIFSIEDFIELSRPKLYEGLDAGNEEGRTNDAEASRMNSDTDTGTHTRESSQDHQGRPSAPLPDVVETVTQTGSSALAGTSHPDFDKVKQTIETLREAIEASEKTFKENLTIRRLFPAVGLVFPANEMSGLVVEESFVDSVSRARQELLAVKSRDKASADKQTANAEVLRSSLKAKITDAQAAFRKRNELIRAGPVFVRHFYCAFGRILDITALCDSVFAVFSAANTLEIWQIGDLVDGDALLKEFEIFNTDPIALVIPMANEDASVLSGSSGSERAGIFDASFINSRRPSHYSAPQPPDRPSTSARPSPRKSSAVRAYAQLMATMGNGLIPQEAQASAGAPNIILRTPDAKDSAKLQGHGTVPRSLLKLRDIERREVGDLSAYESMMSPEDLELFRANVGVIRRRQTFFLGCESGKAAIVEILWEVDASKKTSAETRTNGGEHELQALTPTLEIEWLVKMSVLQAVATDHQPRVVPQDKHEHDKRGPGHARHLYEATISSYCYDPVHKCVIVALKQGVILRLFYDRDELQADGSIKGYTGPLSPLSPGLADEPSSGYFDIAPSIMNALTLKIVWAGNVTAMLSYKSRRTGKPCLVMSVDDGVFRIFSNESRKALIAPDFVDLRHDFSTERKLSSQLHIEGDADERDVSLLPSSIDVAALRSGNFLLAYTQKSTLITLQPESPAANARVEVNVISNRRAVAEDAPGDDAPARARRAKSAGILGARRGTWSGQGEHSASEVTEPWEAFTQRIKVLDEEAGLGVLWSCREWSLFSLEKLAAYETE
ncbi:hypothetical protein HK105_203574 [Polyrhizophydium stewartii]|uniref:Uncharacterized protein n=1 Tax=Polyrhizophydium stewartii TaxID=2732419 RepID=A0ABR4NBA0_9FUNG